MRQFEVNLSINEKHKFSFEKFDTLAGLQENSLSYGNLVWLNMIESDATLVAQPTDRAEKSFSLHFQPMQEVGPAEPAQRVAVRGPVAAREPQRGRRGRRDSPGLHQVGLEAAAQALRVGQVPGHQAVGRVEQDQSDFRRGPLARRRLRVRDDQAQHPKPKPPYPPLTQKACASSTRMASSSCATPKQS